MEITPTITPEFLSGGGEMGKLIRSFDWSKSPLGTPDTWPQSLRTTVSLCIASNFPIAIAWGPHRVQIYNDGYWPITGNKHPASMGQDFKECWSSAWPVIGQAFEAASLGQTRFLENQHIFLDRYGYLEETFFTFSFSPILDESGSVGGLFHPVIELTQQTIAERRLNVLRVVADVTVNSKSVEEASSRILECLKDFELDLPFVLLYSIAADGKAANLINTVGVDKDSPLAPENIDLEVQLPDSWPFTEVIQNGKAIQVKDLGTIFGSFNCGPYPEPPNQAMVFPIRLHGTGRHNYLLVAGVSSRRRLDEKYLSFYELLFSSVSNALTKANAYHEERKKVEALAEIDKAKTIFFNNISHEFRTPLTLMLGPLEELINKPASNFNGNEKQNIVTTHRNAMRLLKLVNTLLDFSRIESGKQQANFTQVDIAAFTKNLVSNFRSVIEKGGLKLIIKADIQIEPVYVDKQMWEKIVFNLLSNAFKYTLEGTISVKLFSEKNKVIIEVTDTGIGIPEKELPHIFERFHRVEGAKGRTHEGTGIGLSLIRELIQLHSGTIQVQSTEGKGSTFTVSIPTGKEQLQGQRIIENTEDDDFALSNLYIEEASILLEGSSVNIPLENELNQDDKQKTSVLIVDDNADMRLYIKSLLEKKYKVITANDGMDALQKIKENQPNLILSDIMMPVMDGIQLLKEIKNNPQTQSIPVILLSARAGEDERIHGYDTGADDYLVKPFSAKELLARVGSQVKLVKIRQTTETNVRNLFMQAPAAICVLRGPQHIFELTNAMYLQLIGNRIVVGKPLREALPELAGTGIYELLDAVYKTGEPFLANEMPVLLQKANGIFEESILNFVYQASHNETGEIDGILVHAVDVTKQVLASKKIEESEEKFRSLIQTLPQLVWVTDQRGNPEFASFRWKDYIGFEPEGKKEWKEIVHPDDYENLIKHWAASLTKGVVFRYDTRLKSKEGEYKWHTGIGEPVRDIENNILKWVGVFTDIHHEKTFSQALELKVKQRTKELAKTNIDLVNMNKELESFAYISSHDLQEPLRKIQTFVTRIKEKEENNLSDHGKDNFNRMEEAARRMQTLIQDLLAYSRTNIEERIFEKTDLNKIIDEVKEDLNEELREKDAIIEAAELGEANIIPFQFRQLLHNLVGNALKFSNPIIPPHIKVMCEIANGKMLNHDKLSPFQNYCHISIADNGIGFEPQYTDKIFEIFQRLHPVSQYKGTGIGLAIVKKIVDNHNGFITATGEKDKGATFDIYLPVA